MIGENVWQLRRSQLGKQLALHTAVPATIKLVSMMITDEPLPSMHEYGPAGQWFDTLNEVGIEYSQHTVAGQPDYNDAAWAFAIFLGNVAAAHPATGNQCYERIWTPPIDDVWTPMPVTAEIGSPERAEQYADLVIKDWKITSGADKFEQSGMAFAGALVDNHDLTASLASLTQVPIKGEQTKLYLDPTSAALGTTQLLRYFEHQFGLTDVYAPEFPGGVNSAGGYGLIVQKKPKAAGQLTLEADDVGLGANLVTLRAGAYLYLRSQSLGPLLENAYTVSLTGGPTGGTFALIFNSQTTAAIAYNAAASAVQSALQALSSIGASNAIVTGPNGGPWVVSLTNGLLNTSHLLTGDGSLLTGGVSPAVSLTHNLIQYELTIDEAIKLGKPSAFKAVGSASALAGNDWPYSLVSDLTWIDVNPSGQALKIKLVNAVPAI